MDFEVMSPDPERRVQVAIEDIQAGRMVILIDDEDRENEGDLTMAAASITPEAVSDDNGVVRTTVTAGTLASADGGRDEPVGAVAEQPARHAHSVRQPRADV